MSPKRIKLKPGDVFEMPLADGRLGYGVIILSDITQYVIILRSIYQTRPELAALARDDIAFVGETTDALIHHGSWSIVFHDYPVRTDVPFPNWKVAVEGQTIVTNFSGRVLGPPLAKEAELLDFKFSRSPIAYQDALEALHRLQAWSESYEKLTATYAAARMTRAHVSK